MTVQELIDALDALPASPNAEVLVLPYGGGEGYRQIERIEVGTGCVVIATD